MTSSTQQASILLRNLATATILAIVGAAAIKEGYYGVVVTEERRRAAWGAMFPDDPAPEAVPFDRATGALAAREAMDPD